METQYSSDEKSANRQIKDGVFRLLYSDPESAAELYYAITGDRCTSGEIEIVTITTTVSGRLKNDLAFVVRSKILFIGEHMASTYANMPVRLLLYTGLLYEKWIKMKGELDFLYSSKLYKIPTPAFVVFYNGTEPKPEHEILRLSAAFEDVPVHGRLELEIPVYNINKGKNTGLFENSPSLRQYAEFVAKLREFEKLYNDYAEAVGAAVEYCIATGILEEFFRKHGGEVVSILSAEYNVEAARSVSYKEGREDGLERGREEGLELGRRILQDEKLKMAKTMLDMGEPISKIEIIVGIPYATIKSLQ